MVQPPLHPGPGAPLQPGVMICHVLSCSPCAWHIFGSPFRHDDAAVPDGGARYSTRCRFLFVFGMDPSSRSGFAPAAGLRRVPFPRAIPRAIARACARGCGRAYRGGAARAPDCARETPDAPRPSVPAGVFFAAPSHILRRNAKGGPGSRLSLLSFYTIPPNVKLIREQKTKIPDIFHEMPVETSPSRCLPSLPVMPLLVMPGLVPGISLWASATAEMDARNKSGHDGGGVRA